MRALSGLLVVAACVVAAPARAGSVVDTLAATQLRDLDGREVRLEDLRGRTVVLNFWASWCAPCRKELPVLQRWADELAGSPVRFVVISIDEDVRNAARLARKLDLHLPLYHDGPDGLADRLEVPGLPATLVIGPDGQVAHVAAGGDPAQLAALREAIDAGLRVAAHGSVPVEGGER